MVELNRAVAVGMASGPAAGLTLVDRLAAEPALQAYHLLPSVRGDFLEKLGRHDEARAEFERAAGLTRNARERRLLLDRACQVRASPGQNRTVHPRAAWDIAPSRQEPSTDDGTPSPVRGKRGSFRREPAVR